MESAYFHFAAQTSLLFLDFKNTKLKRESFFFALIGILDAIGAIVDALANAIVVEYFCVYGTLKPVESVCVGCKARILILSQPIQWDGKACISLLPF